MHKNFQDAKLQRLQIQQKDILQQKYVVAGKNLPYVPFTKTNFPWNFYMQKPKITKLSINLNSTLTSIKAEVTI